MLVIFESHGLNSLIQGYAEYVSVETLTGAELNNEFPLKEHTVREGFFKKKFSRGGYVCGINSKGHPANHAKRHF